MLRVVEKGCGTRGVVSCGVELSTGDTDSDFPCFRCRRYHHGLPHGWLTARVGTGHCRLYCRFRLCHYHHLCQYKSAAVHTPAANSDPDSDSDFDPGCNFALDHSSDSGSVTDSAPDSVPDRTGAPAIGCESGLGRSRGSAIARAPGLGCNCRFAHADSDLDRGGRSGSVDVDVDVDFLSKQLLCSVVGCCRLCAGWLRGSCRR